MGKAGNLKKIGKCFGLGFQQHPTDKARPHFRQRQCAVGNADVVQRDSQRFAGSEQSIYGGIVGGCVVDFQPGIILQVFVKGGDNMPQLIQL